MLRLLADENFNNNIVRGLLRRKPDLDIVRVQDVGLSGADLIFHVLFATADNGRRGLHPGVRSVRRSPRNLREAE